MDALLNALPHEIVVQICNFQSIFFRKKWPRSRVIEITFPLSIAFTPFITIRERKCLQCYTELNLTLTHMPKAGLNHEIYDLSNTKAKIIILINFM